MFSNVVMPDMNGCELALIVTEKYPTIKIQMASGFSDDRQSAMADDTLHQNLMPKPYRAQTLLSKIRKLLDA
jgi:two-component SAPR family response regulator